MAFAAFEDVAALPEARQRELLHEGDAQERVWAAWALGSRLGSIVTGAMQDSPEQSPDDGTRMHFAALLAGVGERGLVETLGTEDPSDQVRATACQYLIKTSRRPNERLAAWVSERLYVGESVVRHRILIERPDELGRLELSSLTACMADSDVRVRRLACEVVIRHLDSGIAADLLGRRLAEEDDSWFLHDLVESLVRIRKSERVLHAAALVPAATAASFLRSLATLKERFNWARLRQLVERDEPLIDLELPPLVTNRRSAGPAAWIASRTARQLRQCAGILPTELIGLSVGEILADAQHADLSATDPEDIREILRRFAAERERLRGCDYADREWLGDGLHEQRITDISAAIEALGHWVA